MENINLENNAEKSKGVIEIESGNKLQMRMFGRRIESGVSELIKTFAIIRNIKEKGVTDKDKIQETVKDLFNEFGVQIFNYEDIFSDSLINQIISADTIDIISTKLNGKPVVITAGSTVESVMENWRPKAEIADNAVLNEQSEKIKKTQEDVDTMFRQLDLLDFRNLENVIDWLYEYNTHVRYSGVEKHEKEVVEKFAAHGYNTEKNDITNFMLGEVLGDRQKYGEAMVGFMLQNLGIFPEQQMKKAIDNWKDGIMKS